MRVTFERSGGFAGLMLTTSLDTATLPPSEANQLRQFVQAANFFQLPTEMSSASQPDRFQYDIAIDDGKRHHAVRVGESSVPESLRPLIDWCMEKVRGG
ncbi:protealysin inhibitor emfourin [Myxacorys almedinensis]|uniref:Uncharacterized protein n=1 Tax=Myxacorys almedinensis A TaxID=2690445 RepID=A0A8J7YYM6_9CYAN|nr:protealysin inhibitor emfourin [Myxacorys almedinensis]NDJ16949.1 hypothetical protein [Myxacorys almedinensis A]